MKLSKIPFKFLALLILLVALGGCGGEVDWFPAYHREPTTPDVFTFPTKTGVALNKPVTSDPITVTGLTAETSPIKITGPSGSNSQYSINGAAATSAEGTVKNNDKVTVTHTSANVPGGVTASTLTIGNISATFSSVTQLVTLSAFTGKFATGGNFFQTHAIATSNDTVPNTHLISISDSKNTAWYSVGDANAPGSFVNIQELFPSLNGRFIYVRKEADSTTTLTIDGVEFPVTLPAQ